MSIPPKLKVCYLKTFKISVKTKCQENPVAGYLNICFFFSFIGKELSKSELSHVLGYWVEIHEQMK